MTVVTSKSVQGNSSNEQKIASEAFSSFEQNWRRVASTHTLQDLLEADQPPRESRPSILVFFLGLLLVLLGLLSLAATFFICFLAKIIPPEDGHFTFMLKRDRYYHLLVPLTVPVTIIMITVNWFSMKLFKHNS